MNQICTRHEFDMNKLSTRHEPDMNQTWIRNEPDINQTWIRHPQYIKVVLDITNPLLLYKKFALYVEEKYDGDIINTYTLYYALEITMHLPRFLLYVFSVLKTIETPTNARQW